MSYEYTQSKCKIHYPLLKEQQTLFIARSDYKCLCGQTSHSVIFKGKIGSAFKKTKLERKQQLLPKKLTEKLENRVTHYLTEKMQSNLVGWIE